MRRLALALVVAALPAAALAASLGVPTDQAMIITLSAPARDVVIGNPAIADVSLADQRHLVITGKATGVTNLVVADAAGHTIFDRQIVVGASSGDRVEVIHGPQIVSYACAPICQQVASSQGPGGGGSGGAPSGPSPVAAPAPGPGGVQASPTTP